MRTSQSWLVGLAVLVSLAAPALGNEPDDWQLWSSGRFQAHLAQRWKVTLEQQFRFQQNMSDLTYRYSDVGIVWQTTSWLETGFHLAQLCQESGSDWKGEHRPFVDGTLKHTWGPLRFTDRHRLERRFREGAPNLWRYRNKFTLSATSGRTRFRILPYVWGGIFVHLRQKDFYRWRLSVGLKGQVYKKLFIDLSYLRQGTETTVRWTHCHVLGISMTVAL